MLTFVRQNSNLVGDPLRSLQPVKSAKQQADVIERQDDQNISLAAGYRLKSPKKVRRNACQGRVTEIQPRQYKQDYH